MDVDELIERAWKAVENAGVSEAAQSAALREAVVFLREQDSGGGDARGATATRRKQGSSGRRSTSRDPPEPSPESPVNEETFFATLASESGVEETDLRDVLRYDEGKVTISPPTRKLGTSKTGQAKAITALVAGARAKGLGESRVRAQLVHDELKRKQSWDQNNFSNKHLGALQGYNVGSDRSEIVTTSKWVGEFSDAVAQALGKADDA